MRKETILQETVKIIKHHLQGGNGYKILLFGSWAKNNALETSDIDIGIIGNKEVPQNLMIKIRRETENIPTLRTIDVVDLNMVDDDFKNNVLKYAKPLSL